MEVVTIVNSEFEAITPKLLVPIRVAELLGLWLDLPRDAISRNMGTAGKLANGTMTPNTLDVSVVLNNRTQRMYYF